MAAGEITPGELRGKFDLATLDPSEVEIPGVGTTGGVARGGGILWSSIVAAASQTVIQELDSTFTSSADISTQVADRVGQGFYDSAGLHVSNSTTAGDFTLVASLGAGTGALAAANNLSDLNNVATARGNLGLGSAALSNSGDFDVSGAAAIPTFILRRLRRPYLTSFLAPLAIASTTVQTVQVQKAFSASPLAQALRTLA